jgi:hypothetical protein
LPKALLSKPSTPPTPTDPNAQGVVLQSIDVQLQPVRVFEQARSEAAPMPDRPAGVSLVRPGIPSASLEKEGAMAAVEKTGRRK